MKLSDVRKMAIRQQTRVRFNMSDGRECVVKEDGIARIPGLTDIPTLDLEEELARATEFRLETVVIPPAKSTTRTIKRGELEKLSSSGPAVETDDHDE
jgi:hypothetical protein